MSQQIRKKNSTLSKATLLASLIIILFFTSPFIILAGSSENSVIELSAPLLQTTEEPTIAITPSCTFPGTEIVQVNFSNLRMH